MTQYVLVNRRSGKFTHAAKIASRATVEATLGRLTGVRVLADHNPDDDPLARRVVLLEADARQVAALSKTLPADAILEPAVQRYLHRRVPIERRRAMPRVVIAKTGANVFKATFTAGGDPLKTLEVKLYLRDPGGQIQRRAVTADAKGKLTFHVPRGYRLVYVEPVPYAGFWSMWAQAPPSGTRVECPPLARAQAGGRGWWHDAMRVDVRRTRRGAGIKVGVIDTGCGPHRNLAHVTLVGAFVDGTVVLRADKARDVGEHGTHTTGIIGARPTRAADYAGMAPGCELFHARVFKSEEGTHNQADLINAIDSLSRHHHCDLINMSLGEASGSRGEEDAIQDAAERGTLCVCSAGNESLTDVRATHSIDFPAAYSECAAVSAIGKLGWAPMGTLSASHDPCEASRMGRDNLFLASTSCFGPTLACTAPGVGIVSTVPDRGGFVGAYMVMDGTSAASPAACGVLAVILSQDATYKRLPRDRSRSRRAALALAQHCKTIGLPVHFEGRGLPTV